MPTWARGKYLLRSPSASPDKRRNITQTSQTPQSNSKNASQARSDNPQADFNSSRSVPVSRASGTSQAVNARTTSINGVAVARSGNMNSKSKKPAKKSHVIEISDPEDDDLLERGAALASPAKGAESRKATMVRKSFIYPLYTY